MIARDYILDKPIRSCKYQGMSVRTITLLLAGVAAAVGTHLTENWSFPATLALAVICAVFVTASIVSCVKTERRKKQHAA